MPDIKLRDILSANTYAPEDEWNEHFISQSADFGP